MLSSNPESLRAIYSPSLRSQRSLGHQAGQTGSEVTKRTNRKQRPSVPRGPSQACQPGIPARGRRGTGALAKNTLTSFVYDSRGMNVSKMLLTLTTVSSLTDPSPLPPPLPGVLTHVRSTEHSPPGPPPPQAPGSIPNHTAPDTYIHSRPLPGATNGTLGFTQGGQRIPLPLPLKRPGKDHSDYPGEPYMQSFTYFYLH